MVNFCWKARVDEETRFHDGGSSKEIHGLVRSKDLGFYDHGQFSMAVIQANSRMEDQSQLESGPLNSSPSSRQRATYVGVYDGHGGAEASQFVKDHLILNGCSLNAVKFQDLHPLTKGFAKMPSDKLLQAQKKLFSPSWEKHGMSSHIWHHRVRVVC